MMNFSEYQKAAYSTCTPECFSEDYLYWGLISEVGELAGKEAKMIRGDDISDESIMAELGDIAWFIAVKALYKNEPLIVESWRVFGKNTMATLMWMAVEGYRANYTLSCLVSLCSDYGFTIDDVMAANIKKLASRKQRGVIQGEGDNR